ncbi:hypothetical protein EDB82DRAFT_494162 [Fusarium venenatum]|nr:hypothetical protein EDB82DRAFT_494162 [Fusarium venenatum]
MTAIPTVDQLPSFIDTASYLANDRFQCIWYLPYKKRFCKVQITPKDNQRALQGAKGVWESRLAATSTLQDLATIAEDCCCARHHRNKIWGSGLAGELADRWQNEIRNALGLTTHGRNLSMKTEGTKTSVPITFAKHQVLEEETLLSKLQSPVDPRACKTGSLYFYTHANDVFGGMIKIGYTSRTIDSRLHEWAECGNGYPELLYSLSDVRHPERVELLIHFEFVEWWYAQRWCEHHRKAHIEWFKVDLDRVRTVARLWCQWMQDANPYDRRGRLTALWAGHIEFLVQHENPITAGAMVQIQKIEEGSDEVYEFIDDKVLRKKQDVVVKEEVKEA